MDTIHKLKVSKMFPAEVYQRGKAFVEQEQVSDLLYDMNNHLWTANVHTEERMHFVELNVKRLKKGSLIAYCDCPAFAAYGSCEHIVAVLLSVQNRSIADEEVTFELTEEFIQRVNVNDYVERDLFTEKTLLSVEYYCFWNEERKLFLELRVGKTRTFIVRNLFDFVNNVLKERDHYFTKTFTYDPDLHYFSTRDLQLFELIFQMLQSEAIYHEDQNLDYERMKTSKRAVLIPFFYAESLLKLLVKRDFFVDDYGNLYEDVSLYERKLPFQFSLESVKDGMLTITLHGFHQGTFLPIYNLLFIDGSFYIPTKEQIPLLEQIDQFGLTNFQLPISRNQMESFISEVVPSLKRLGSVEIDKTVEKNIVQVPLRAEFFLDVKNDALVGELHYRYGRYTIDPFDEGKTYDVVLIRDVEKEQTIMNLIETADFRYNGQDLYIDLMKEESLYEFFYTFLPVFEEHAELYLSEEVKKLLFEEELQPMTKVNLQTDTNLLEVGFDVSGIRKEELPKLLQAVIEKRRYYRTNSGAFLSLENKDFMPIREFLTDLNISKKELQTGSITLPAYRAAQVDEVFTQQKHYNEAFKQLLNRLRNPEKQTYPMPKGLNASLRNYQKTGYQWLKSLSEYSLGGILADDMGLGKTLQSIAYLLSERGDNPHLVVVPSSVLYNWKKEFEKFAPSLSVMIIHGPPEERLSNIKHGRKKDVWITSYATLRQDIQHYEDITFQALILDEAQYIKNHTTKTHQAVRHVQAKRRFALTGTPIENSIDELWSIFQGILPGLLPSLREFRQLDYDQMNLLTRPFILRRVKEEVLTELPEKIESVSVSELTKEQKELYLAYLHELRQEASEHFRSGTLQKHRMEILAGITRLRQICCHPSIFIENYTGESGKLNQLLETVQNSIANGKRMLIFSQFTSMHEIIIKNLEKIGVDYFYLYGQTPAEERIEMSERFNRGEKEVFLISLRAGGTGLNLTGADTVLLYDLWWNPAVEDQATGRAHRFGQKNVVQVLRFITEGTIEEKIYELQQQKRELIDQIIQPGETMLSNLSEEDIKNLLNL